MDKVLKILMLEDNTSDAEIILTVLKKSGLHFESFLVMNKKDFLLALDQYKPDLILADNTLPQFNATEALNIFHQRLLPIPFILVTGSVSEEFAAGIIKLGADDYILKDRLARLPGAIKSSLQKKEAEEALRYQQEGNNFKARLLAMVGQAVIATDMEGAITYWNTAAQKMYGWSLDEAMGKNIINITPSLQSKEQAIEIMEELKKGDSWSGELMMQRKDGTMFPAFVTDSPIYDKEGNLKGIIGISNDISEQKNAERELIAMKEQILNQKLQEQKKISRAIIKTQERERNHLGKELHDNISQILAGAKLYLSSAGNKDDRVKELVKYPMELIDNSIQEIRLLSRKHVTPLKNIDLENLIDVLINDIDKNTSIKTEFVYVVPGTLLNDELKLNIYRLIQELINNVIKHAAPENLSILIKEENNFINIDVKDDGKGFDVSKPAKGIGINNIINRIESFNGTIKIQSSEGMGCYTRINLPVLSGKNAY